MLLTATVWLKLKNFTENWSLSYKHILNYNLKCQFITDFYFLNSINLEKIEVEDQIEDERIFNNDGFSILVVLKFRSIEMCKKS